MKKLWFSVILLFCIMTFALTSGAGQTVKAYQCQNCTQNNGVVYGSNSSGDMLIAVVVYNNNVTVTSISDTAGNSWSTTPDCVANMSSGYNAGFYHAANIKTATNNQLTVSASGTVQYFTVLTDEVNEINRLDTCGAINSSSYGTSITAQVQPSRPSGIIYGYGSGMASIAPGTGATLASVPSPASGDILVKQTSTGSGLQTVNMTQSPAGQWFAIAVAYGEVLDLQDIYLAQTQSGTGDGSSCANAAAVSFFNNSINWGTEAGQIGPGKTVHLCGLVSTPLTFQGSGASGSPVTLLFESGASMQQAALNGAYITLGHNNYITIDGGTNGAIHNTNNGTAGSYSNQVDTSCIAMQSGDHDITVQNLACGPLYVRIANSSDSNQLGSGICCSNGNKLEIKNSIFHDAYYCIATGGAAISGISIHNNNVYNCSTGVVVGDGGTGTTISNVQIFSNHIHDGANWDGCWNNCTSWNHNDGVHIWTSSGGMQSAPKVYNNVIDGSWGQHTTAFVFMEADVGDMSSPSVYNNLLHVGDSNGPTNGLIEMKQHISSGGVYNNTMDCGTAGGNGIHWELGSQDTAYNNLFTNCGYGFASDGTGSMTYDYSAYWNTPSDSQTHLVTTNPDFSGGYVPSSSWAGVTEGTNLSSIFTGDIAGTVRPSTGGWTIGAYQVNQ